ncbi:hypothetical protein HHK36_001775 [Tetracentron sinense]|uniref:Phosphotyrosine protein phosphatase domain-containing protein n=1 Tax=Tetracentron sinense TaxID=13715 RepID=A0A835A4B7_TETSI|nr:hypothetical protein HHK36_001775 [Tetracentron sinense]
MPQVIVIDEIGTKLEAMAASTIAQRGIQLVATAHGVTIENLIMNPSLEMLVGGIQHDKLCLISCIIVYVFKSVTLGDEEASRRGVQKTVLERKGPSTFTSGVEIISKVELRVHRSLEATVDAILSGRSPKFEVRKISSQGLGHEMQTVQREPFIDIFSHKKNDIVVEDITGISNGSVSHNELIPEFPTDVAEQSSEDKVSLRLYVYGVRYYHLAMRMDDAVELTDNISEADALLVLQSKLKKNPRIQAVAKSHDIPIYVTKITKAIEAFISGLADGLKDFESEDRMSSSEKIDALEEARLAIEQVVIPKGEPVELLPRHSHIISLQMDLIQKYQLQSEKVGKEPDIRLRILPFQSKTDEGRETGEMINTNDPLDDFMGTNGDVSGSLYSVDRLPLLPD